MRQLAVAAGRWMDELGAALRASAIKGIGDTRGSRSCVAGRAWRLTIETSVMRGAAKKQTSGPRMSDY